MTTSFVVNGIPDCTQRGPEKEGPCSRARHPECPESPNLLRQLGDQGAPEGAFYFYPRNGDRASQDVCVAVRPSGTEMELQRFAMLVSPEDSRPTTTVERSPTGSRKGNPIENAPVSIFAPKPFSAFLRPPPGGADLYLPPMGPRKGLGVAPRNTSNETHPHLTPALLTCVSGGDWGERWSTEVVACEGRGTGFWGSSETVDSVALGHGVMEIQKGAPLATRNQGRHQVRKKPEERPRKSTPGHCGVDQITARG